MCTSPNVPFFMSLVFPFHAGAHHERCPPAPTPSLVAARPLAHRSRRQRRQRPGRRPRRDRCWRRLGDALVGGGGNDAARGDGQRRCHRSVVAGIGADARHQSPPLPPTVSDNASPGLCVVSHAAAATRPVAFPPPRTFVGRSLAPTPAIAPNSLAIVDARRSRHDAGAVADRTATVRRRTAVGDERRGVGVLGSHGDEHPRRCPGYTERGRRPRGLRHGPGLPGARATRAPPIGARLARELAELVAAISRSNAPSVAAVGTSNSGRVQHDECVTRIDFVPIRELGQYNVECATSMKTCDSNSQRVSSLLLN